jgi:hypothetical protein
MTQLADMTQEQKEFLIEQALSSEEGRVALAASMANPIRLTLDYQAIGRKLLVVDPLPQGALPVYDKDVKIPALIVSKRGQMPDTVVEGERITVPTFEIGSYPQVRYSQVKERRYNLIDRAQQRAKLDLMQEEDLNVFNTISAASTLLNPETTVANRLTRDALVAGIAEVGKWDLIPAKFVMNFSEYADILMFGRDQFDPVNCVAGDKFDYMLEVLGNLMVLGQRVKNHSVQITSRKDSFPKSNSLKNKSYEQIYGKEKALEMKKLLSGLLKKNNPQNRKDVRAKNSLAKKGKTYEEIFGIEQGNLMREKRRQQMLKNNVAKTLEARKKIVLSKEKFKGFNLNRGKVGYREDLGLFFRSRWEANFARLLNLFEVKYVYEPKRFLLERSDGSIVSYLPDFWVETLGSYVEVKGYMDEEHKEKIELFKKQYPLIVVDSIVYNRLEKMFKWISNWETESSETIRRTLDKSEDIVRSTQRCVEQNRNASVLLALLKE